MEKEIDIKHQKIKNFLEESSLNGVIFASQTNFLWLTGGKLNNVIRNNNVSLVYLLFSKDKRYLIATNSDADRVMSEELEGLGFELVKYNWYDQNFIDGTKKTGIKDKIGADFSGSVYLNVESEITDIRRNLTNFEIQRYISFCKDFSRMITNYCLNLKKDQTENEIAAGLRYECFKNGIRMPVLLVGSDERIFKFRHPCFTNKKTDKYILIATCAERDGIHANVSRSIYFGKTPAELLSKQKAVNYVISRFFAEAVPGKTMIDFFETGKAAYKEAGYPDEWENHLQGGISGYKPLEYVVNAISGVRVNERNIMGFNPTITGAKTEDPILIEKDKSQITVFDDRWPNEEFEVKGKKFRRPLILEL